MISPMSARPLVSPQSVQVPDATAHGEEHVDFNALSVAWEMQQAIGKKAGTLKYIGLQ